MATLLERSRIELAGEYEKVQKKAFTNWVNSHLIKAGQKVNDLYEDFRDGNKLLLLLELLTSEKLHREKGKMRIHKLQNVKRALDFLQNERKIKLVNIRSDEIVDGNAKLILGLVWTLILHFQISGALTASQEASTDQKPPEMSAAQMKAQLLEWAQRATEEYEDVEVTNFHRSWRDGLAFCAILDRHRPDLINYDDCDPDNPMENLERAFKVAEEQLGIVRIVDPEDICVEKPDEKAVMTYVSFLRHAFPTMPPPHRKKVPPVTLEEYRDLYEDTRQWIEQKTQQVKSRDFPNTSKDMKARISEFQKYRSHEVPVRQRDMDTLSDLYDKLQAQKKKRPVSPTVPPQLAYPDLVVEWTYLQQQSEECEKTMQGELERLEKLESQAARILSECDTLSGSLEQLERRADDFEVRCSSLSPEESVSLSSEISKEIQVLEQTLGELSVGVQELREGNYHDVDRVQEHVDSLKSRLASLSPRLSGAQVMASEVQAVVAMESNLQQLEEWLVSCGKFADNQQILMQIEDHKVFQLDQLALAEQRIARINCSPPPPGLEEKFSSVNDRWQLVVKQTKDRLSSLEPIAETVRQFDSVKDPLEESCTQKREYFDTLPPLEVTEEQLLQQQVEMQTVRAEIHSHKETVERLEELSLKFIRDTEPLQSLADRYARKLKSREMAVTKVSHSREGSMEPEASLGEQAGVLQAQWEWLRAQADGRSSQISDLLVRLHQFNKQYEAMRVFVREGNELLEREKPVGNSAARVQEQMDTCQIFRSQITSKEAEVDAMLSLGRAIISEPNTNPHNDTMMQKLTGFIEDWSELQLAWQNWYNELHANLEQSKSLSEQLNSFVHDMEGLEPACANLFPATLGMDSLDSELKALQAKFNAEVLQPYKDQKATYESLKTHTSLLSDPQSAEETFRKFETIASNVESYDTELSAVVLDVEEWWSECVQVKEWLSGVEETLINQKPLAASLDLTEEQKRTMENLAADVDGHRAQMEKVLSSLATLATHDKILIPDPVNTYLEHLRRQWGSVCQEAEERKELVTTGRDHLTSYAEQTTPFRVWLSGAEARLELLGPMPRNKERLFSHVEEFDDFMSEVESHEEAMDKVEQLGSQFLGCAKAYQKQLVDYRREATREEVGKLSEEFVDPSLEDFGPLTKQAPQFEGEVYENGIKVVGGDSSSLRKRYDALLAGMKQQKERLSDAKMRRQEFDSVLEAFLPSLSALEVKYDGMGGVGDGQSERIQERVETVQGLELECLALEPQLQSIQSAYNLWAEVGQSEEGRGVEGEDDALGAKESAEMRYHSLLDGLKQQKTLLDAELSDVQSFQDAFTDFITWLRETERKIQRDDPLKLEVGELQSGLAYLQGIAADIIAHEKAFEAVCSKCQDLIGRRVHDSEELQRNLESLQQRWNALQIIHDDIEVIEETIPKLEAFYSSYSGVSAGVDELSGKLSSFSASAISTEGIESKRQAVQELSVEVAQQRSEFEALLGSCDLLETPFDQSQFESNVSKLQEKMNDCDKVAASKMLQLKDLEKKVRPMEDLLQEFRAWLSTTEQSLAGLGPPAAERTERKEQLGQAMAIIEDVKEHREALDNIAVAVNDVIPLLDEQDRTELNLQLQTVTDEYHTLMFSSSCYPVERWLEDQARQLCEMAPAGVLVSPLQEQVREVHSFQRTVANYAPEIESLASLAVQCTSKSDQSAVSVRETGQSSEKISDSRIAEIRHHYDDLKAVAAMRLNMLSGYMPPVQQYESSQSAWTTLLCGWEDKAATLPSPGARPETIQEQIEEIKALQQSITDHEPELISLKKEAQTMCKGPSDEPEYFSKLSQVSQDKQLASDQDAARPGQQELEETLTDFTNRLEALRQKLSGLSVDLGSQLEKANEFQDVLQGLLSWVAEAEGQLDDLKVHDTTSTAIEQQLQKCQSLLEELGGRAPEKEKLAPLLEVLSSHLPDENPDRESLRNQLDELNTHWSALSDKLHQNHSNLESSLALAKSYEGSLQKLLPWVPDTLNHLENLGPPPLEPEAVEKLKSEIESLKSEYNSLASMYGTCTDDGNSLAAKCENQEARGQLEVGVARLQSDWEKLGKLFGDTLQKLTDALVQTQEFQAIANGWGRWMEGMWDALGQQDVVAARVKLIETQVEGFKPTLNDISAYAGTVEKAKTVGAALIEESDPEERRKIQSRLESLTSQFTQLEEAAQTRMASLEDALQKATVYEDRSNQFDGWLREMEGKLSSWEPFSIASQPLKRQEEASKEFHQKVESHKPDVNGVSKAEETLFATNLHTIQSCESHILKSSQEASQANRGYTVDREPPESSVDKPALPDWLQRSGAPEAVEVGADLRGRYDRLKLAAGTKCDEASQLLQLVLGYEADYDKFREWLDRERTAISSFPPPAITLEELRAQLQKTEDMQQGFKNREESLESLNSRGTELVDQCKDELSRDSGRIKLSDLNESWGNALTDLGAREDKIKEGVALAEKYQSLHDAFDSWLSACEERVSQPVRTQGDPLNIRRQQNELQSLLLEIRSHRPQLDEVVGVGHELEEYTDADRASLPDIGYSALQERYEALKVSTGDHISSLEGTLEQASNLKDKLKELLEKLERWRAKLKGHKPPHVRPNDVQKQLDELACLQQSMSGLQPAIVQAQADGGIYTSQEQPASPVDPDVPSGLEIQALLTSLGNTNSEVKDLLGYWRDLLLVSLDTAKKFDTDCKSVAAWMKLKEEELSGAETVRGVPEKVEEQLQQLQVFQDEISQHQSDLDSVVTLGHSMADNAAPEDSVIISDKLAPLQTTYVALQRSAFGRKRVLEEGLTQAKEFASAWSDVMDAITVKQQELEQLAPVGVDIDTVKIQLEEYKDFEASLLELKPRISAVLSQGKQLRDSCSSQDGPFISSQLEKLNTVWAQLYSSGLSRKHQLEDALLQLGQFHDALAELLSWIATSTARLYDAPPPGVRPETVEAFLQEQEGLESGIASHEPSISSLREAGEKLLTSSSAENTAEIQQDLLDMNNKWESLKRLAAERNSSLTAALKRARSFNDKWKNEVGWFSEAERHAYGDWKPCGLPETCDADITKHEAFLEEVQSHRDPIDALKVEGEEVKGQGSREEQRMVDRWVGDIVQRWEDLYGALEDRQAQLQEAKGKAEEFNQAYLAVRDKIAHFEEIQEKREPIHSEVEAVEQQLETHKEYVKELTDMEDQLDELEGLGLLLSKGCVRSDKEVVLQRIADLRSRGEALNSAAIDRQSSLEESLLSLGQFEGAYDELWAWLSDALRQLDEAEPITGDPTAVAAQLSKHKALQKQLGARMSSRNAVMKAGRVLMKQKTGEDKALLRKKLGEVEREWERVCQLSVERQDRLEQAHRHLGQFRSHLVPLRSWMTKVLPTLDESEPVRGDIETVDSLIAGHATFQKELGSHQKSIEAANTSGDHLVSEVLDDPTLTRQDLQELNEMWENICQQSVKKQERLNNAYEAAKQFEEKYAELNEWIDSQFGELQAQPPPNEDATTLQHQIDAHKALSQDVASRQPDFDKVQTEGQSLLQLAHPKAVPLLRNKSQQLERKWVNLRGRVGARSEELASARLELHGLQDMLDNLWQWVGEAEAKMAETETTLIANDLEAVEQQLADHEGFQEDMATHQPNMDALNKANKKRKATHPQANPEMTKRINSLFKRWQKLWLRSSERHRHLLEARTRLNDIALARSFNFEAWKKRFLAWVDQQKLRLVDLFRKFDGNHDGMLTREEFMKALKASGLAMNQIELEKIADAFDQDHDGLINLNEIMAILKGTKRSRHPSREHLSDAEKIEHEIQHQVSNCTCSKRFKVTRVGEGQYRFGDSQQLRLVRILRSTVMVRVGGGWEPLAEFLHKHDPCRVSGRTNAHLRGLLTGKRTPGLTTAGFTSKRQTATAAKNAAMRKAAEEDPEAKLTTRTLPSGRKETTVTTKKLSTPKVREGTPTRTEPIQHTLVRHTSPRESQSDIKSATPQRLTEPKTPTRQVPKSSSPGQQLQRVGSPASPAAGQQLRRVNSPSTQPHSSGSPAGGGVRASRIPTPKSRIPTRQS